MKPLSKIICSENLLKNFAIFACLFIAFLVITVKLVYPNLGLDAGYYLKIAYDISKGLKYFSDLSSAYTPLGMYLFSIPFYFDQHISLSFIYLCFFVFEILNAFLIYQIIVMVIKNKRDSLLFASVALLSGLLLDNAYIVLEPMTLTFILFSVDFLILWSRKNYYTFLLLAGAFEFLAFFTKQYGIFALPASVIFIYLNRSSLKNAFRDWTIYLLGFTVLLLLTSLYFNFTQNLNIEYLIFRRFIGIQNVSESTKITGSDYSLSILLNSIYSIFFKKLPYLMIIFTIPFFSRRLRRSSGILIFYTVIILLFLPVIFCFIRPLFSTDCTILYCCISCLPKRKKP